ncbi:MAG: MFS transporter [Actinobacteria bacterium]|nr:MFS transporter [Actinomycetota bacterium]
MMLALPLPAKLGYATGDLGISIAYFALGFFFLFYLTDVVGLSAAAAGTVVLIGKLWDGVNDPLIGILNDRTRTSRGRKRTWLLYGAVPFALSFVLLWWLPTGASPTAAFLLATAAILLFATAYSVVAVPYNALVPVLTRDYDERTQLVAFKAVTSALGTILGGGIALLVTRGEDLGGALHSVSLVFGVVCGLAVLVAARSVTGYEARHDVDITRVPLRRYVALATEASVSTLLWFKLVGAVATGVLTASIPYFAAHVLGSAGLATVSLAIYTVSAAALVPVANRLTHRVEKPRMLLAYNAVAAVLLVVIGFVASTGSTLVFLVGSALLGAAMSAYLLIPPSLVPDLVDHYEWTRGERHESVFFGLWMTVHQLGLGVAGFVLGLVLQVFGYDGTAEAQTAGGVLGVRIAFGVVPGLLLVRASLILLRYHVTRARYEEARLGLAGAPS